MRGNVSVEIELELAAYDSGNLDISSLNSHNPLTEMRIIFQFKDTIKKEDIPRLHIGESMCVNGGPILIFANRGICYRRVPTISEDHR